MSKPITAKFVDAADIRHALGLLRHARNILARAGADKAADKVRRALKSAEGASRHADGKHRRIFPEGQP